MLIRLSTAAFLLLAAPAAAADGEQTPIKLADEAAKAAPKVGGTGGSVVRTVVGLFVVISVIYGLTWILRRFKHSQGASGTGLSTVASLPLGSNRSLHLVRAGREVVLLGVAEGSVTPIKTYAETEAITLGLLGGDEGGDAPASKKNGSSRKSDKATDKVAFLEGLRNRTVI